MKFTPKVKAPVHPQIHAKLDALIKSNARQEAEQKKHTQLLTKIDSTLTAFAGTSIIVSRNHYQFTVTILYGGNYYRINSDLNVVFYNGNDLVNRSTIVFDALSFIDQTSIFSVSTYGSTIQLTGNYGSNNTPFKYNGYYLLDGPF